MYRRVIFEHKQSEPNGDIIEIRIREMETSEEYPEGVRYSFVYIRNGKHLVGYDNYHGKGHHRHVKEHEEPYEFIDVWKAFEDFDEDIEKVKKGVIA